MKSRAAISGGWGEVPQRALVWRFSKASGPGGQGVNTTDSRAELRVDIVGADWLDPELRDRAVRRLGDRLVGGHLVVVAAEHRSQLQNRRAAMHRLADLLTRATAAAPAARVPRRPSRAAGQRRLEAKRARSQVKAARRRPLD